MKIREKRTLSGPLLEADIYPIFDDGRRLPTRKAKTHPSSKEMQKYNRTCAVKKFIRLVNANFGNDDYLMHPTYRPELAPQTETDARRDLVNYLRRVKTKRASLLRARKKDLCSALEASERLPGNTYLSKNVERLKEEIRRLSKPFRYIYVIERQVYKTGALKGCANWHFHLFMTGGIDARVLEGMWPHGIRVNVDNYQPEKFGPESAARYMSKDPQGSKRFCYSRNLQKPKEKIRDGRITRRQVEIIANERIDDAAYWERRYKGYKFMRCFVRWNEYNANWYVSAVMYKTDGQSPKWEENEWLTEAG